MLMILELILNKCIHDELIHMYTRISGHTWISGKMVQILGREHEKLSINKCNKKNWVHFFGGPMSLPIYGN